MLIIFITYFSALSFGSETIYVRSVSLVLKENPDFSSTEVSRLARNDSVVLLETKGLWYKVKAKESSGWAASIAFSKQIVAAPASLLGGKSDIGQSARKRSSAVATAGAARGLLDENLELARKLPRTNADALKTMMGFKVPLSKAAEVF
jgi:hypothetical protein